MATNISKPPDIEELGAGRQPAFDRLDQEGKRIVEEYGLEPDQIEVNTSPTGSTWVLNLFIKDERELRTLLSFMKDHHMIEGFE